MPVSTNDLGEFRLAGLQPGKYIVCANPARGVGGIDPGDGSGILGMQCYPGLPEAAAAIDVRGPDNRINFTLSRAPGSRIRGTLAGASRGRRGLAGAPGQSTCRN